MLLCEKVFEKTNSPPLLVRLLSHIESSNILYERLLPLICDLLNFKWPALIQTDHTHRNKSLWCDYHRDHRHETDRCQSLKFLVEKLIKARHLQRCLRELDYWVESRKPTSRITASPTAPPKPRPTINYLLGGPTDDQYQSKHQQKKLVRAAMVKVRVNVVHTESIQGESEPIDDPISFSRLIRIGSLCLTMMP